MAGTGDPFTIEPGAAKGLRFLIVEARFHEAIASALSAGAQRALSAAGAVFDVVPVPGALEIPAAIGFAAARYDGFVALGCVIRGETTHYEIVTAESARGLMNLTLDRGLAIGNGILTVESEAQAIARARPDEQDKGGGAAVAAIAMALLKRKLSA